MVPSTLDGVRFQVASDQSLLIYFEQQDSADARNSRDRANVNFSQTGRNQSAQDAHPARDAHQHVRKLLALLEREPIAGVRNIHPAYHSILVQFDAMKLRHQEMEATLREYLGRLEKIALPESRVVEIPVCYGGEHGPDLEDVAAMRGMTVEQVIELHASTEYVVYFLGFVPGFAYLGELPEALATPRLPTPRKKVPAGSVGIAGRQTGVYPFETPGGWRLLGRTPLAMFRPDREGMSLLAIGDRVRFASISHERFAELERG